MCQGVDADNPTVQSDKSAKVVRPRTSQAPKRGGKDEEVLSSAELERVEWGRAFKRQVKMAAASVELYEDAGLADAVGVSRNAVTGWWRGSKPTTPTLLRLAQILRLPVDEVIRWVYSPSEPPRRRATDAEDPRAFGEAALEDTARRQRHGVPQRTRE